MRLLLLSLMVLYAGMAPAADGLVVNDTTFDARVAEAVAKRNVMHTHEDTVRYVSTIKSLYAENPADQRPFLLIAEYCYKRNDISMTREMVEWMLNSQPDDQRAWLLLAETEMTKNNFMEAAAAYRMALQKEGNEAEIKYNLALCLLNKAALVNESDGGDKSLKTRCLDEAQEMLEAVRLCDPKRMRLDWVAPLYTVYQMKGDRDKAEELKPFVH